jgi:hypothetical protein
MARGASFRKVSMLFGSKSYLCSFLLVVALACGCTSINSRAANAPRVPFATLAQDRDHAVKMETLPLVMVFEKGDRIPVRFDAESALFEIAPRPVGFELVASRRFYLLLLADGPPRVSIDGVDFEKVHKNSFRFGFMVDKDKGALTDIAVGIWREAPAAQ